MRIHDWSQVPAGIFHDFHHAWIEEIKRALNSGILPGEYYALAEQRAVGFGPDVLTLQANSPGLRPTRCETDGHLMLAEPQVAITAETDLEFYRRKQSRVVVRHVSDDRVVAMIEVISAGNKSSRAAIRNLVEKAAALLEQRIHLLILDLHAPGPYDPEGIHGAIWEEIASEQYHATAGARLTLVAYESALTIRAFVQPVGVGDWLIDMPLYLEPGAYVLVPLGQTYTRAVDALPHRWRSVIEEA